MARFHSSELYARITRIEGQIEFHKLQAQWWIAYATTGAVLQSTTKRGREPTAEEAARGEVIGWQDLTDQEKVDGAMQTSKQHLSTMLELYESKSKLMEDLNVADLMELRRGSR